jgi:iron(III) transport system substrate-binding protein
MAGMRSVLSVCLFAAIASGFGGSAVAARTSLTVYSTLNPEDVNSFKRAFEADNPEIEIVWVRDATGVISSRIMAAGERQQADAIWGLAVTSMIPAKEKGYLIPYAPRELASVRPQFRDAADPPSWVGIEAWVSAVCFNTVEAAKYSLPTPKSWFDLANPIYKGRIVMPHPASSGTGYFHVSAWIQLFGEEKAWAFMDDLHKNVAYYEHSGTKPCRQAAVGEFAIGISAETAGATLKTAGAPIDVLLMQEGGGWDMDTAAILVGTKHLEAAQRLMDFATSRKANELYAQFASQVAIEGIAKPKPNYPEGVAQSMIKNDLAWAAANKERILTEWTRRYGKGR